MAIKVREVAGMSGGETSDEGNATILLDVKRAESDSMAAVRAAVLAYAPATFDGKSFSTYEWQEEEETRRLRFTLKYSNKLPESVLRRGFDATGGTIRLFASQNTQRYPRPGRTAPDFRGLIGVKDGDPEGVDVTIPALRLNYRYRWPANTITNAYVKAAAGLVGSTCTSSFDTYNAGELLLLGVSGEIVDDTPTEITYAFAASADVSGLSIGDISGIVKGGHDYLWIAYEEEADGAAKKAVKRPLAVYVERVYRRLSWGGLGLGL